MQACVNAGHLKFLQRNSKWGKKAYNYPIFFWGGEGEGEGQDIVL